MIVKIKVTWKLNGPLEFFYDAVQGSYLLSLSLWKKPYVVIFQMKASEWQPYYNQTLPDTGLRGKTAQEFGF